MRPAAPAQNIFHAGGGRPARVHKNYWQQASKRGAAKELRFLAFSQQMWLLYMYWEACPVCLIWYF